MYLHVGQISGPLWVTGEQNRQTSKTDTRMCIARQGPRFNGQSDGDFGLDQSTLQQFGQANQLASQQGSHLCEGKTPSTSTESVWYRFVVAKTTSGLTGANDGSHQGQDITSSRIRDGVPVIKIPRTDR